MDQSQLSNDPTRCILTFSNQHQAIRLIFEKYWFLLKEDSVLSGYMADRPSITYRRARSLRDELVRSHFVDSTTRLSDPPTTTPCGSCEACPFVDTRGRVTLPNGELWVQKHSASCHTTGVIYWLQCVCGDFYVGKTRRSFSTRIREQVTAATSGFFGTVIGRHFALKHDYCFMGLKFLPLMVLPRYDRGGDWDRLLLQTEARWIFCLRADHPPGLNEAISFAPFL